jgi:hypothetical protein
LVGARVKGTAPTAGRTLLHPGRASAAAAVAAAPTATVLLRAS